MEEIEEFAESGWYPAFKKHTKLIASIFHEIDRDVSPVYPKRENVFRALRYSEPSDVKVVLVGLDPYHKAGQAIGFSFAVNKTTPTPPSLRNILKELKDEGYTVTSNQITKWVRRGVLLLNVYLTVREGQSLSYKGWKEFTLDLMKLVIESNRDVVFLLLGAEARRLKGERLYEYGARNFVEAGHPSPLSSRYFFGSNCFRKAQDLVGGDFTWDL